MKSLKTLRENRNVLAKEVHDLVNGSDGKAWTPAMQASYDEKLGQIDSIDAEINRHNEINSRLADEAVQERSERAAHDAGSGQKPELRALFQRWLRGGDNSLSANEWANIRATMSTTTSGEGGYSVPTEVSSTLIDSLKSYAGVRQVATVIRTDGFGALNFPASDGTSEVGELIAENTTATAADPSFTVVAVTAYKYSSKIIAIPFELLQDSAVDMEAFIRQRIVDRLGRITNTHFTTGTGSGQPRGVVTGAAAGKTGATGQTLTVKFGDLVDLVHSVDPAYRQSGSCAFMMKDATLGAIRGLLDSQNRPIFIPGWDGLGKPMPDTILGYRVVVNPDVATMAANAKSVLFGDFSKYVVRDVMQMSLFRFTDSAYTKLGQVGFLAWLRSGGNLLDSGAVKYYANSAT